MAGAHGARQKVERLGELFFQRVQALLALVADVAGTASRPGAGASTTARGRAVQQEGQQRAQPQAGNARQAHGRQQPRWPTSSCPPAGSAPARGGENWNDARKCLQAGGLVGIDLLQQVADRHHRLAGGGLQHARHLLLAPGVEELQPDAHGQQDEREYHDETKPPPRPASVDLHHGLEQLRGAG